MQGLSFKQLARARGFLLTEARPLDGALFKHRFEAEPAAQVLAELGRYQNADGGFGQALEPDLRTTSSSPLCTGIGLHHFGGTRMPFGSPARGMSCATGFLLRPLTPIDVCGEWFRATPTSTRTPRGGTPNTEAWRVPLITVLRITLRPEAVAAGSRHNNLRRNVDYVIETQASTGDWEPTGSWGAVYPTEWEQARQEWRGCLTLQMLTSLHAHGRIDAEARSLRATPS